MTVLFVSKSRHENKLKKGPKTLCRRRQEWRIVLRALAESGVNGGRGNAACSVGWWLMAGAGLF
jgi:hypothetical protein